MGNPMDVFTELNQGLSDADLASFTLNDLIRAQHYARQEHDKYKKISSDWEKLYDLLSIHVVPARMEEEGEEGKKLKDVGRVELRSNMWTSTKDAAALRRWLEEHDLGDIVVPSVNGSTLKALLKEMIERGQDIPDESIVEITPYTRAVIVKG